MVESPILSTVIDFKPQLLLLTYPDGLKTFVSKQTTRRTRVNTAIDNAAVAVEKASADVVVPVIGDTKRVGNANVTLRTSEDALLQNSLPSHAQWRTMRLLATSAPHLTRRPFRSSNR